MIRFKTASAFVLGRSHEKRDIVCQDKTFELVEKNYFSISLADGAGSCEYSHLGAYFITKEILLSL